MSKQTPKQQSLCNNKFDGLMNAPRTSATRVSLRLWRIGNRSGWTATRITAAGRGRNFRMAGGNVRRRRLHG